MLRNKQELRLRRYFVATARRVRFTMEFRLRSIYLDAEGWYT